MVTDIKVKVSEKVASVIGAPVIICGNSDYTVTFNFDAEWATMTVKTARFLYKRGDSYQYIDVTFSGNIVVVPILTNIEEVYIGVYAGELHTTTPTRIICKKSILCEGSEKQEAPPADIYQQLLEVINNLELLPTVSPADKGKALMVRADGHWVVELPDFVHNQKDGEAFRVFFGTFAEWDAWDGDKTNVFFIPTDDNTLDEIYEALKAELETGEITPANTKTVNGLEIKQDAFGVLKIGNTTIPQKKAVWGPSRKSLVHNSLVQFYTYESVLNETLEIYYERGGRKYTSKFELLSTDSDDIDVMLEDNIGVFLAGDESSLYIKYDDSNTTLVAPDIIAIYKIIE